MGRGEVLFVLKQQFLESLVKTIRQIFVSKNVPLEKVAKNIVSIV